MFPETRICQLDGQAVESIYFLVNKMMMNNQVNIEGKEKEWETSSLQREYIPKTYFQLYDPRK